MAREKGKRAWSRSLTFFADAEKVRELRELCAAHGGMKYIPMSCFLRIALDQAIEEAKKIRGEKK